MASADDDSELLFDCFSASDLLALYALPDALEFDCAREGGGGEPDARAREASATEVPNGSANSRDDGDLLRAEPLEVQWGRRELNAGNTLKKAVEGDVAPLFGAAESNSPIDSVYAPAPPAPLARVMAATQPPLRLKRVLPIQPAAVRVLANADKGSSTNQRGLAQPKGRKRVKDEIESLRQSVVNLEQQLRGLRHEDGDAALALEPSPMLRVSPGSRLPSQSALVTVASSQSSMLAHDLWKRVAGHQLAARRLAEAENARLRDMLLAQARLAESLQRSFRRCPRASDLDPTQALSKIKSRSLLADPSREGARIYASMAKWLESLYASVDAVLVEAGHSEKIEEFNVSTVKTDAGTGQTFVDLASAFVLPFEIKAACSAFWALFNKSSGDANADDFQKDLDAIPAVDSASCTIRAKFTVAMPFRLGDVWFEGHILGKRFVEDSRIVFVWCTQGTCESKAFDYVRTPMRESGWSVLQRIPPARSTDANAATIIRTVFRIHPDVDEVHSENQVVHTLADAVAESFQENAEHMIRAAESIIMSVAAR